MKSAQVKEAILFTLLTCVFAIADSDLASDRAGLVSLRSALGGRTLLWNTTQTNPCRWTGVTCTNDRVTMLRLPAMGLSGSLPSGLGNLTELQTLSLRFNALTGPIPADFVNLKALRNLYLQGNFFSGELPDAVFALQNLVRLNLGNNNFSGEISPKFNGLTRLSTLYLERNNFTGSIPDLSVPPLDQFNVSYNSLTGPIPNRFSSRDQTAFLGNSLCGKPLQSCPGSEEGKSKLSGGAIAGIVIGSVVGLLLILLLLFFLCRKRSGKNDESVSTGKRDVEGEVSREKSVESGNSGSAVAGSVEKSEVQSSGGGDKSLVFFGNVNRVFSLDELLRASAEVLGKGTFGTTYKATLEMGVSVAVKRLKDVTAAEREFREKIEQVGKMVHHNLVPLRGYYFSRDEKLVVYDYMPMGSLSALLHANGGVGRTPLNWETRSSIALGAARGIAHIHSHGPTSSHGNIKASNILLTKSFEARVSDFGLAYLALPTSTPNRVSGYRAPEITDARKVSQKADVYSFGIMLLELLTGKAPAHSSLNDEGVDLPRWVQSVVEGEWNTDVFDMELLRYQSVEDEMVKLLQLALECTAQYPDKRPSMDVVATKIEEICHSSLEKEEGKNHDFKDPDHGFSQQYYSVDSGVSQA
ncbi:probable inactive receptor kinase At1g48480 [Vigna unguiculata]|uniref:Protein brassinosteroid insensitive 1 n=1 Tax=Vigna unguiculata TaxID=3917 RepID=A0A4D6MIA5_VIGUN|nr:probable inactive receptor kinase At1g48480 [Vigna unguiculata]QCE01166.1 protein brassinosteroid insensitive 1 [Vigna unguiculata]QCE04939.1 protein brassinosteroid insensitive 1 [Vigna unguiculata]